MQNMLSKTANLSSTLHKKEPLLRVVAFFSTTPKPQDLQERISEAKSRIGSINNFGENLAATTHQKFTGRNRFYKEVSVVPVDEKNSKFKITLDGRELKTPNRNHMHLTSFPLAIAIAAEWDAQENTNKGASGIQPVTMPLSGIAITAIDQLTVDPDYARRTCISFLPTDTALFLTTEEDRLLLRKQRQHFQPLIRWVNKTLGEERIELDTTQSLSGRIIHPQDTVDKVTSIVNNMDIFTLACLQRSTMECKSLIISLAYIHRYITLEQAKAASRIEEEFQLEIWGVVEGGHDMDRLNNTVSLSSVGTFMGLHKSAQEMDEMISSYKQRS